MSQVKLPQSGTSPYPRRTSPGSPSQPTPIGSKLLVDRPRPNRGGVWGSLQLFLNSNQAFPAVACPRECKGWARAAKPQAPCTGRAKQWSLFAKGHDLMCLQPFTHRSCGQREWWGQNRRTLLYSIPVLRQGSAGQLLGSTGKLPLKWAPVGFEAVAGS